MFKFKFPLMASEKDSKLKALQLTLDRLDKTYGKGTVMPILLETCEEVINNWNNLRKDLEAEGVLFE